jgi:cell division protein FtsX
MIKMQTAQEQQKRAVVDAQANVPRKWIGGLFIGVILGAVIASVNGIWAWKVPLSYFVNGTALSYNAGYILVLVICTAMGIYFSGVWDKTRLLSHSE